MQKKNKYLFLLFICWVAVIFSMAIIFTSSVRAAEVTVEVKWAVNDMPEKGGFIMHHKAPGQDIWLEVWKIEDVTRREWTGNIPMEEGVNQYAMTTFSGDIQSEMSDPYTYEWLAPETPGGVPVPTVLIQFTAPR